MKTLSKTRFFPWSTLVVGLIGFALRCWLFSDFQGGLLPANHPAGALCFVLLALMLAAIGFAVKNLPAPTAYTDLFPQSVAAAAGTLLAAVGFGISAFSVQGLGFLRYIVPVFGVIGAVALAATALSRLKGRQPLWMLHCVVTVYLMLRTMACSSAWSAQTQLQLYFFQLLACCFLLLAGYYRVALGIRIAHPTRFVFFSQAALFCCCLCCAENDWLFYLSAGLWMAADYCDLSFAGREIQ